MNGRKITNLRFADDITLVSESELGLTEMMNELSERSAKAGLHISAQKTIIITKDKKPKSIEIDGKVFGTANEETYLGQRIAFTEHMETETNTKITKACAKY